MVVAVVLVGLPGALGLGSVVAAGGSAVERRGSGQEDRAMIEEEADLALEADGVAEVNASREVNRASARRRGCVDGAVDGGRVESGAVAFGAEGADAEGLRPGRRIGSLAPTHRFILQSTRQPGRGRHGHAAAGHLQQIPALHARLLASSRFAGAGYAPSDQRLPPKRHSDTKGLPQVVRGNPGRRVAGPGCRKTTSRARRRRATGRRWRRRTR